MWISSLFIIAAFTTYAAVDAKCPDKPLGILREYQGTCIEFIKTPVYQSEAKEMCTVNNGQLLTIENKEKQAWIQKTIMEDIRWVDKASIQQQPAVWLGIRRERTTSGDSSWHIDNGVADDSNPIKYENWGAKEPSPTKNRDCAVFGYQSNFKWKAALCGSFPFEYPVICEYDQKSGLFVTLSTAEIAVAVILPVSLAILIGMCLFYKCHMKRRELERRLHDEESHDFYPEEYHIKNTDKGVNGDQNNLSTNNNTPTHYKPVVDGPPAVHSHHDFNILADSGNRLDKLHSKDFSLMGFCTRPAAYSPPSNEYTATDSAPPSYVEPSAPSETCSVNMVVQDDYEHNSNESSPLHAPTLTADGERFSDVSRPNQNLTPS